MSRLRQLRLLLQEWRLISSASSTKVSTSTRPVLESRKRDTATTTEPESRSAYEHRSLPLLPGSAGTSVSRRAREISQTPSRIHPTQPESYRQHRHRHRKVEPSFSSPHAHEGPSPLEGYVMDAQTYEMLAIGLVKARPREWAHL